MRYTFCNNNPPARITVREATEQKLNILLEWPNIIIVLPHKCHNLVTKYLQFYSILRDRGLAKKITRGM